MIVTWLAVAVAAPGNGRPRGEEVVDGLPPWMEQGEQVRLDVVRDLLDSGNTTGALDILKVMRGDGFDGPMVDLYQGTALRLDGITGEAERLLVEAQRRMRDDPRPSSELCLLYADDRRMDEAIEACRRATKGLGADAAVFNNYAFLLLSTGHADEALEPAEKAIELDGSDPTYRNNLGLVQAALGREDQAFRTLQSTMPKPDAAYLVGVAVERARGAAAAAPWFDKALQLDPHHTLTRQHLADPTAAPAVDGPGAVAPTTPSAPTEESP